MGIAVSQTTLDVAILLLVSFIGLSQAQFDEFYFDESHECPVVFTCPPPQACAHHRLLDKWYCCGSENGVCWSQSTKCQSDGTQTRCGSGINEYCCKSPDFEQCTQRANQSNICYSLQNSVLHNVSSEYLTSVYASLSSATPQASTISFNATAVVKAFSASTTQSSLATNGAASTTAAAAGTSTPATNSDSHSSHAISGGAIGGIVVGAICALGLIALTTVLLMRMKRRAASRADSSRTDHRNMTEDSLDESSVQGKHRRVQELSADGTQELPADDSTDVRRQHEMPTNREPQELGN